MNKVILMGRLTRDPEIRYTQGENSMCIARYTLAVDRRVSRNSGDEQTADFISCVAFGKAGEHVEKYYRKGLKVAVTGRIQTGSYTNRDGIKVYTTEVIIEEQEFAESRSSSEHGSYDNGQDSYDGNGQNQYNGNGQNQRGTNNANGQYNNQGQRSNGGGGQYNGGSQNQRGNNNANGQYNNQGQRSNGGGGQNNAGSQNQRGGNGRNSQYNGQGQRGPDYQNGFMNIPDGIDEELPFT